jgi:hypothetical protein
MPRIKGGRILTPKEEIPDEPYDPRFEVMGYVKGNVEQEKLLKLDLTNQVLFPQTNISVFWDLVVDSTGDIHFVPKSYFINLFNSIFMHLRDLPVFGTTSEVVRCTKFLFSQVENMSLWLDRRYPIHGEEIQQLTGFSLEGEDVSKGFQGPSKHGKRKGEVRLYEKFHTHRGGCTTYIELIIQETVLKTCYVISSKVMHSYYKGKCTLYAFSIAYFYANGAVFIWCRYLLEELLIACEEAQDKGGTFTYGYILIEFSMSKWKPPTQRQLAPTKKGFLAKMFEPWHARSYSENMDFNNTTLLK